MVRFGVVIRRLLFRGWLIFLSFFSSFLVSAFLFLLSCAPITSDSEELLLLDEELLDEEEEEEEELLLERGSTGLFICVLLARLF